MPDEVVATAPATPATPVAPAAAPAVAPKGGMLPGESFAQAMQRHGGFDPPSAQTAPAVAPAAAPAPEAPSPKGKAAKKEAAKAAKAAAEAVEAAPAAALAVIDEAAALDFIEKLQGDLPQKTLNALAKKLGLDVDGARVSAKERIEFREQKRKHAERMQREERELITRLSEAKGGFEQELNWARAVKAAQETGNYEQLAQHLGAKDWNDLQEQVIARLADPNYKRMRELEQREAERERRERQAAQEYQQRQEHHARQQALQEHSRALSEHMKASRDPLVSAMHDDPGFINSVIEIQRQHWDGSTTVTPEQAIKIAAKGFNAPLAQTMRQLYDRLQRVYGATPAQAQAALEQPAVVAAVEAAQAPAVTEKGKKNKTSAPAAATGNAPAPPRKFSTKREADAFFTQELQKAIAADRG